MVLLSHLQLVIKNLIRDRNGIQHGKEKCYNSLMENSMQPVVGDKVVSAVHATVICSLLLSLALCLT